MRSQLRELHGDLDRTRAPRATAVFSCFLAASAGAGTALDDEEDCPSASRAAAACGGGADDGEDDVCDSGRASKVRRLNGTACVATAASTSPAEATISPATTASGAPNVVTPAAPRSAAAAGSAARPKTPGSAASGGVIEIVDSDDDEEIPAVSAILKRGTNTTAGGSDATKSFLSPTAPVSTSAILASSISIHASAPLSVTAGAAGAAAAAGSDDMPPLVRTAAAAPTTNKSPVVRAGDASAAAGGAASPASTVVDDNAAADQDDDDDDVVVSGAVRRNPLASVGGAASSGGDSDAALAAKLAAEEQMKRDAELAAMLAGTTATGRRSASTRRAAATASRDADADGDAYFDMDDDSDDDGGGGRRRGKRGSKGKSVSGAKRGRGSMGEGKPVSKAAQKRLNKAQEAERKAMEDAIAVAIKESLQKPLDPVEPGTVRRQLKWPGEVSAACNVVRPIVDCCRCVRGLIVTWLCGVGCLSAG